MSVSIAPVRASSAVVRLRPAVDSRPPAEQWSGLGVRRQLAPPDQPALRLIEELDPDPLPIPPERTAVPITIDVTPAGVDPAQTGELVEHLGELAHQADVDVDRALLGVF